MEYRVSVFHTGVPHLSIDLYYKYIYIKYGIITRHELSRNMPVICILSYQVGSVSTSHLIDCHFHSEDKREVSYFRTQYLICLYCAFSP